MPSNVCMVKEASIGKPTPVSYLGYLVYTSVVSTHSWPEPTRVDGKIQSIPVKPGDSGLHTNDFCWMGRQPDSSQGHTFIL